VPREEILQKRGLDVAVMDSKFERKAAPRTYTVTQEAELEVLRAQLTKVTAELRHANEHELPEESFRAAETAKRQELNDLVEHFDQLNAAATAAVAEPRKPYTPRNYNKEHRDDQQPRGSSYNSNNHHRGGNSSGHNNNKYNHTTSTTEQEGWATLSSQRHHHHHHHKEEKTEESEAYASFFSNRRRHPRTDMDSSSEPNPQPQA
jgi:hypothetical protein